jgi:3-methyladenine DNA glycosylase/8-oxoguanine DNA glycosylase
MRIDRTQVWRAMRTPEGAATLHLSVESSTRIRTEAWGPGAGWALDHAAGLAGTEDDDTGFEPKHEVVRVLWKRHRSVRLTRATLVMPIVLAAILEQKVTGVQARRAWRLMVRKVGEPAPGPLRDLVLPPDPARLAALPYFAFHPFGVERRRAEVIKAVCSRAARLEGEDAIGRLGSITGIGPWTLGETARLAFGDPDAVSVGDFHLPNLVAWALAGEPRGDDERMLELLEPYRGHRGRLQLLLETGHIKAPAFGPRMEVHSIERL